MKKTILFIALLLSLISFEARAASSSCFWGYCGGKVTGEFGSKKTGKGAIYIPAEISKLYQGKTISVVKVGLAAMAKNVKVFITKDLNGENTITKTAGMLYNGWNEVKLSSNYTIDGEPFYIGYSYEGDNLSMGRSDMYSENGCWADLGDGWKNYAADKAYKALSLTIQAKIAGENMPKDLWLYSSRDAIVKKNAPCEFGFGVMNMSPRIARTLLVGYTVDGGAEQTEEFKTTMGSGAEKEFAIEYPGFSENGIHSVKLRLISVDGENDAFAGNDTTSTNVKVMDAVPQQRFVVEEGTGTWCGWCPLGIVGLNGMAKKYPETFIGIAVHKQDKLETSSYSKLSFKGYPSCYINRDLSNVAKPEFASLEASHNKAVSKSPRVGMEIKAHFVGNNKNKIKAVASASFFAAQTSVDYKISFVLVENGIEGYYQANNFSGGGQGKMGGFEDLPGYASINMDHVARMNYSFDGIKGSIPTTVEADQIVEYAAELEVPGSIQHADSLHLIALLINSKGQIENAASAHVTVDPALSISEDVALLAPEFTFSNGHLNIEGFEGKVRIYDANGRKIPNHDIQSGFYIIKYTSGNKTIVKKMLLK